MFDFNDPSITVQMCKFQALIEKAHIVIKFPCSYFVEWKTINNRYSICTQKRVRTANDEAVFNEKLTFYTEMVFNTKKREYYSKETFLLLNLVSKSRPDQVKLVGRVSVDLAEVLNRNRFSQVQRVRLNYCSVEGSVVFGIKLLNKRESNLSVKDLDRSAFTDYFSLNPINRMMIEESMGNGNYSHNNGNLSSQNLINRHQPQQEWRQYARESPNKIPKFAQVSDRSSQNSKPHETNFLYHHKNEQIISFQNSEHEEPQIGQSPRTNYSKEQSLIEKLQQKNLRNSEKENVQNKNQKDEKYDRWDNSARQKINNVVEIQNREPRTERFNPNQSEIENNTNSISAYTMGNKNRALNRAEQEVETGQIRRQQGVNNKPSSQTKLQSAIAPIITSKPTSPPSHERQLTHINSSSKFSENSESQNQQLLSIVQKLQHEKLEQESMIQSLKAMLVNKNMRKKETSRSEEHPDQKKFQETLQENKALRKENDSLIKQIEVRSQEVKQKNMHVFELLDKIKKLEAQLSKYDQKIKLYEDEIAELHMKEIENQKICQSLKLSLTMQPGYDNLVKSKEDSMALLSKKSDKILDHFRTPPLPNKLDSEKLSMSQYPEPQEFKITITKDQKIYEEIEQQNEELNEKVKELMEEIEIYKDLLKQQNSQPSVIHESLPLGSVKTVGQHLDIDDVPFTITVSKNTNIYQNYENLEEENTELYQRIKELEQQVLSYKELMKDDGYPRSKKEDEQNIMVESVQVQDMGEYHATVNSMKEMTSSQPPNIKLAQSRKWNSAQSDQHDNAFETTPNPKTQKPAEIIETFKIILTKDKSIYKEQEEENIELSRRVIELQEQIQKYKQLIKSENDVNSSRSIHSATKENEEHYEGEGFTITLSKDKNIFENQEKEIQEYEEQVKKLEDVIGKYKMLYGPINDEPTYKVSITREERIYEDQEQEIKELLLNLQQKDDQLIELTTRLSWLERQLQERDSEKMGYNPGFGQSEFKIKIHRDENIYDEQERDIKDLSERVVDLDEKLKAKEQEIFGLKKQLADVKKSTIATNSAGSSSIESAIQKPTKIDPKQAGQCSSCASLKNNILELQTGIQLLEEQKSMLEDELGALEEEKFCFTSTQNELKITIEDLREEINLLGQENERLVEEIQYLQKIYGVGQDGDNPVYGSLKVDQRDNGEMRGENQWDQHQKKNNFNQERVDNSKFALSLPEKIFNQYKQTYPEPQNSVQISKQPTHHLQELPQSPRSNARAREKNSQSPSKILAALQEENTHLRQSLTTFEDQLQEQYVTIAELEQRIARLMHDKEILFERDQQLSKEVILLSEKEQEVNDRELKFRERIGELEKEVTFMKTQSLSTISTSQVGRKDSNNEQNQNSGKVRITELQNEIRELKLKLSHQSEQLAFTQQQNQLRENELQANGQQLQEKQRQIEQLQTQLESLNQSLNELSVSYQSLQQSINKLEQQKESQVESIRQEYESMNRLLKEELESIESIILEKQRICEANEEVLMEKEGEIERLKGEVEKVRQEQSNGLGNSMSQLDEVSKNLEGALKMNEVLKLENDGLKNTNECLEGEIFCLRQQVTEFNQIIGELKGQITRLNEQVNVLAEKKVQIPLSAEQISFKTRLLSILTEIKGSKEQQSIEVSQIIPLISQKLNQSQFPSVIHGQEQLARLISKEVQKIKINIMRNYQTVNGVGGVIQRTVPVSTGYNKDFKSFAEKSAMLNYLKPIEELIKGY